MKWVEHRSQSRLYDLHSCPEVDAVVVLGAKIRDDGRPTIALEHRLQAARDLFASGRAQTVVVSADDGRRAGQDERACMVHWLEEQGVEQITLDVPAIRTMQSVEALCRYVADGKTIVICSQRDHLSRTLWLCDARGVDAVGLVAAEGASSQRSYTLLANAKAIFDVIGAKRRKVRFDSI